jgi:hypothetical protein
MRGSWKSRSVLAGIVAGVMLFGGGPAWSKGSRSKDNASALWIAADRVVGFVPFTVTLYGKVPGSAEPGRLELCRDVPMQTDFAGPGARGGAEDPMTARTERNTVPPTAPPEPACSTGTLVRTQDGFDYKHEMRFDRAGTYRVRLSMVDATGHRVISNTVQVNAL